MSLNDVSMECSKSFVNALQELKSLRPQLYSAAEYCEKSYVHNEEKQLVLDNLKDYVVRALVNSVDHLGTVANKLTDLYEQQRVDALTLELNVSCLNQRILTSQTYTNVQGLRKQQTLSSIIRHQKHYILPETLSRMAQKSPNQQTNAAQTGAPTQSIGDPDAHSTPSVDYRLTADREKAASASQSSMRSYPKSATLIPGSNVVSQRFDVENSPGVLKPLTPFRSFDKSRDFELHRHPMHSKNMLVSLFGKTKSSKQKKLK
ncbi:ABI family protein [Dioscorea alata]|uniref:ABI family protein n=1 Tax=Dioscorea alata TaxID=55571 RepID=A0ACB7TU90_DIOAL|nr:ABI family protein [Dioscorea alata]